MTLHDSGRHNRVGWDEQTDVQVGLRAQQIVDSELNHESAVVRFATAHHDSRTVNTLAGDADREK